MYNRTDVAPSNRITRAVSFFIACTVHGVHYSKQIPVGHASFGLYDVLCFPAGDHSGRLTRHVFAATSLLLPALGTAVLLYYVQGKVQPLGMLPLRTVRTGSGRRKL